MRTHHLPPARHIVSSRYASYPHSAAGRAFELFIVPALILAALFLLLRASGIFPQPISMSEVSVPMLAFASGLTVLRLVIAYFLALICAVPLALIATHSPLAQKFLLPLFDILQSLPALAFFPVLVVFFLGLGLMNGATIFILFIAMLWNLVFALIGGIGLIPRDIIYAADVFGVRGFDYLRRVVIPAIIPQGIVGSILALAQGWNIIIVAEVIRTYLPASSPVPNLFGLGSLLVSATAAGQAGLFLAALGAVVLIIAVVNFFVWQKLLKYAQRFRFE